MFIQNKYYNWYFSIISRSQSKIFDDNLYYEIHHIIPRCMGGDNSQGNLVKLTAREHYIVHLILPKMVQGRAKYQLQTALWRMCSFKDGRYIPCASAYESAKQNMASANSVLLSGRKLSPEHIAKLKDRPAHNKGKKMPVSHGDKISAYRQNLHSVKAEELSNKISKSLSVYHNDRANKGTNKCPKFRWELVNTSTNEFATTTNLKEWCKSQGFSTAMIYKGASKWVIAAKYRLKDSLK